ncbi:MAG: IS1634 family transposase [Campylobacterota bacterium]|nr:IS1634 family transposase [Campylobacterota bacterium]
MSTPEVSTQSIDHLGLVAGMIEQLDMKACIETELPTKSDQKILTHADAISAMILNGLGFANRRLYLAPQFFEKKAVNLLLGKNITADQINDDSLGRTLDAIYAYGASELYEKIALKAMQQLEIVPQAYHLDSTSFHVDGQYNSEEDKKEGVVHLVQGYSRDHHPELNQVVLNLIVEHQSGIPMLMQAADGNQSDKTAFGTIIDEHIGSLKAVADNPLFIADAALYTKENLASILKQEIDFISRVPLVIKEAKIFQSQGSVLEFTAIDDNYSCIQKVVEYADIKQQWVLYRSTHAAVRESKTVKRKIEKERIKEKKLYGKLSRQAFFCEEDALKAQKDFDKRLKWHQMHNTTIISKGVFATKGRPPQNAVPEAIHYFITADLILEKKKMDQAADNQSGYFILATNRLEMSPEVLLREYKSQQRVERGFRFLKSPEFLASAIFLKKPERIEALLMIMTLCLMVYAGLEYTIRKELKEQDKSFPNQLGKPVQNPTTRWVFECFMEIQMVMIAQLNQSIIANLKDRNTMLLDLLGEHYWQFYRNGN